jgi:hypothetical protein
VVFRARGGLEAGGVDVDGVEDAAGDLDGEGVGVGEVEHGVDLSRRDLVLLAA